jgi:hypothetical protein
LKALDIVETSDSELGAAAKLEDHDGWVALAVNVRGVGFTHLDRKGAV